MNMNIKGRNRYIVVIYAFFLMALIQGSAAAQSRDESSNQSAMHSDAPGAIHKQMAQRAGEYTTRAKFQAQSGAAPIESTGTANLAVAMDGRFLMEENFGTMFGQPYKGMRLFGYNNGTKQYEAMWVYTASTAILKLTGTSGDDGKSVTYSGSFADPSGNQETLRAVVKQIDDDHFTVELYGNGGQGPVLETTYTRKTAAGQVGTTDARAPRQASCVVNFLQYLGLRFP